MAGFQRADDRHTLRFRRIVVAFNSALDDPGTVETAASLASRLRAELLGLFVENIDWVRLAEHPELSTVDTFSTHPNRSAAEHLRRALKSQCAHSRRAVEEAAARRRVRCRFEVRRGHLVAEVLGTTTAGDLIVVGMPGRDSPRRWDPSAGTQALAARAICEAKTHSVLLLCPSARLGEAVISTYDGSEAAGNALAASADIADHDGGALIIALLTARLAQATEWQQQLSAMLRESGLPLRFIHMPKAGLSDLLALGTASRAALIALPAEIVLAAGADGPRLLQKSAASVLMVRSERADAEPA